MIRGCPHPPERPGIYLFKTRMGKILYVGKSRNLNNRVRQYFQRRDEPLIRNLLERSDDIEYVVTDKEEDALLLEYNLVQTHQPPFNIRLKDDKSYPYVEITRSEPFPALRFARKGDRGRGGENFFLGPITSSARTRDLIDLVARLFRLRQCADSLFRRGIPCLFLHIDRCSAPCAAKIGEREYRRHVDDAIRFLSGRKSGLIRRLEHAMRRRAAELKFEDAQQIKEDVELIRLFRPASYIAATASATAAGDADVIAIHSAGHESRLALFTVRSGNVVCTDYFQIATIPEQPPAILAEFIAELYRARALPSEIIVPFLPESAPILQQMLSRSARRKVRIVSPRRGKKMKLLDLARHNLNLAVVKNDYLKTANAIAVRLRLERPPLTIDAIDISHIGEQNRVGAAVVFSSGQPQKSQYRNYLIRSAAAGDPPAMKEVLERRYRKLRMHPDLILVDGGRSQLQAARAVKKELGIGSDVVALAKEREEFHLERGGTARFPAGSPELLLFQNIRDEAHRRAVAFHRRRREKPYLLSGGKR